MVEHRGERQTNARRTKRKITTKVKESTTSPSSISCQGDSFLNPKKKRMDHPVTKKATDMTKNFGVAENGGAARRDLRPTAAGGEKKGGEVEVGESGADGGVERGAGTEGLMSSEVEREKETVQRGGRNDGAVERKERRGG